KRPPDMSGSRSVSAHQSRCSTLFEPLDLFRRQLDFKSFEAVFQFDQSARSDEWDAREVLCQHIGQSNVDWRLAQLLAEFNGAIAATKVLIIVPAAHQFLIAGLVPAGEVGKEAARLA